MAQAISDGAASGGYQPDIQQIDTARVKRDKRIKWRSLALSKSKPCFVKSPNISSIHIQENGGSYGHKPTHISQQCQMLPGSFMSANLFDPGPGDRDGSFAISQCHDQQLMPKSDLSAIHNQVNFVNTTKLRFQPLSGNRFIPFLHPDDRITQ